jgi:hypothetical protein
MYAIFPITMFALFFLFSSEHSECNGAEIIKPTADEMSYSPYTPELNEVCSTIH